MIRFWFGGTIADYATRAVTGVIAGRTLLALAGGVRITFWTAKVGGIQYTDLLVGGVAATSVTTDASGQISEFQGPDGVSVLWADAGGERVKIGGNDHASMVLLRDEAQTAETAALAAQTAAETARDATVDISNISTSDGVVEALVRNTAGAGPLTSAALSDTYGAETGAPAGTPTAFHAGGADNVISAITTRAALPTAAHVEGFENRVHDLYGHGEGSGVIVDGKFSHAEGNANIATGNDSHVEGNRNVAGRRYYPNVTTGSEDAGDSLGVLQYVLLPATEGDVASYFPNALTDTIATRYGAGATADVKGNIYPSGYTAAVWTGDVPTTPNDLRWAMHRVCILRGSGEQDLAFATIAKAVYSGGQTKIYYLGVQPFATLTGIYSSYASLLLNGGNGIHAEGIFTSAVGYGASSRGYYTRAWGHWAHAEGMETEALNQGARTTGKQSKATREYQEAYSAGKRLVVGDNQTTRISYSKTCADAGWHELYVLMAVEASRSCLVETTVLARQTAGATGVVGDTFAYKFTQLITTDGVGEFTHIDAGFRTLVGRSAGLSGDGLATGCRVATHGGAYPTPPGALVLRFDGEVGRTFYITTTATIQELA